MKNKKTNMNVVLTVSKILLNNSKDEKFTVVNVNSEGSTVGSEVYIQQKMVITKVGGHEKKIDQFKKFQQIWVP